MKNLSTKELQIDLGETIYDIFICEIAIFKKGKPELWYYSDEYSCKRCYMKI